MTSLIATAIVAALRAVDGQYWRAAVVVAVAAVVTGMELWARGAAP